ncbi:MAG: hypothetical protein RRB13_04415 [bacterium]|nr:hypothetical protein [bacterium]
MLSSDGATKGVNFPRISTWALFALQLFTGGLFAALWLAERKDRFNEGLEKEIVHTKDLVLLALFMGFPMLFEGAYAADPSPTAEGLAGICALAAAVWMIVLSFRLTDRLRELGELEFGNPELGAGPFVTNKLWAFLFQFLYLNYKINELQQFRQLARAGDEA